MIGKTISHYKILEKLGAGGMGEVYLAEDTELDRKVALKFLPPQYTEDPEINARFKREAKAAAALNHPNIITIHEVGEHEGKAFIAMEYVEGQSLNALVGAGHVQPMSMNKVLDIASQICAGLSEAHQAGIVHRDIKPDNILIDTKGRVKIADFGLAKARGRTKLTEEGSTMGTLNYMSPEQLSSADVDQRSDIWSFGVMLYEMITGRTPFEGDYDAALSYAIMNEELEPLARYKSGVSEGLQHIIDKALDKERDTRYQNISDLLADLKREARSPSQLTKPVTRVTSQRPKPGLVRYSLAGGAVLIVALGLVYFINRQPSTDIQPIHKQVTFTGKASLPTISPDGKYLAFVADEDQNMKSVRIRETAGGEAVEVFKSLFFGAMRWSPDGSELLVSTFVDSLQRVDIFLLSRFGASPKRMPPRPGSSDLAWSPDGSEFASTFSAKPKGIWYTNKLSGEITFVSLEAEQDELFYSLWGIDWSPRGDKMLVCTIDEDRARYAIWTMTRDGSDMQKVVEDSSEIASPFAVWSPSGDAIYYLRSKERTRDLMKVRIDPGTGKPKGSPAIMLSGLQMGPYFTFSGDGKHLLYTREQHYYNLWLGTVVDSGQGKSFQTKQLTKGTSNYDTPSISPDGKWIAFSAGIYPKVNIFTMPLDGGQMSQVTFLNSYNASPAWSPDGDEIAFGSTENGTPKVWRMKAHGHKSGPFVRSRLSSSLQVTWHPNSHILYRRPDNRNFYRLDPETEEENLLVEGDSSGYMWNLRSSPDGKKVAVFWNRHNLVLQKNESGLWVISLEDGSQRLLVTNSVPIGWSRDSVWIYAFNLQKTIIKIAASGGKPIVVTTIPDFEFDPDGFYYVPFSMTSDAKRFVYPLLESQSEIWVAENFDPAVK